MIKMLRHAFACGIRHREWVKMFCFERNWTNGRLRMSVNSILEG